MDRDHSAARSGPAVVAVAFSGGRDSTALLHSTLNCAAPLGLSVLALHVNHGLMPQADRWQRSVRARCLAWARRGAPLRLICERIADRPAAGDSIEAWARRVRYHALGRMALAAGCDTVLLAHHRRDRAETVLLQSLRGAGPAGVAAMPSAALRDGVHWLRPWLDQPRSAIENYLAHHRLRFIDDDSNDDPRFARNRLRRQVWPALLEAFPDAETALADAARHARQAAEALHELATVDLTAVAGDGDDAALALQRWLALSPARRSNALRSWLQRLAGRPAPAALVERLLHQWPGDAAAGQRPRGGRVWDWGEHRLLDSRSRLVFIAGGAAGDSSSRADRSLAPAPQPLSIRAPGRYRVPGWSGELVVERTEAAGLPLARLGQLQARARSGGERFQAGAGRPPRSLKKQFQAARIPAWQRDGPLIYAADGDLLFVPGLGLDARCTGFGDGDRVTLCWSRG